MSPWALLKIPKFWRHKCLVTPFHFLQAKFWFKFISHQSKRHILFISLQRNELIPASKVNWRHPYMKIWPLLVQVVNETLSINHLTAAFWKFSKGSYVELQDKSDTKGQQNQGLNFVPFPSNYVKMYTSYIHPIITCSKFDWSRVIKSYIQQVHALVPWTLVSSSLR